MNQLLYGAAYYDEYMPYDRLEKDIEMMKAAGINVVRIAESTWSTWEPQNGVFDFYHLDRVLDAMEEAGISVIVGTPTYAFPTWLAKEHPEILGVSVRGEELYGRRQNMDITSPAYLFYGERIIRKIMERVADRKCVIGFQLDNETKHYDMANPNIQHLFIKYLKEQFADLEELNREFGLDYWSNRINAWEDFPNVLGTINGSLGAEFNKFQRLLVTDFLAWQADIVEEYRREDQFVTHNFDFDWRGYSYGLQPDVNHFAAAKCLTMAGCDIYHPTQDDLTGTEISLGGDITRSLKKDNYLVLETEAQGFPQWVPYEGQLRQQAFSHVASGANMVSYWHWHSIHNSFETYWKGLLSHDLEENDTYLEAKTIGRDFARFGDKLVNLKKFNKVAMLVSNESLTGLRWFPISADVQYNDVLRWCYDGLYRMNVGCDILFPESENLNDYQVIVVPALYSASEELLTRLKEFVSAGGHLIATFKTGFSNEHLKVYHQKQPHILWECFGVRYNQFTIPKNVTLSGFDLPEESRRIHDWMEFLKPEGAEVLSQYEHPNWGKYAAVTQNRYGEGTATYIGCFAGEAVLEEIYTRVLKEAGIYGPQQELRFPVIVKHGINDYGNRVRFYFNYSAEPQTFTYFGTYGTSLVSGEKILSGQKISLRPWDTVIIEEE